MKFYEENAKQYAESTFNTDFAKAINSSMKSFLQLNKDNVPMLDIGCGSGRDAHFLTTLGYDIIAYDQSAEMIEEAKSLTQLENTFNIGSAQNFKNNNTFDFAYSIACLLHLNNEDLNSAIDNIFKHLNKNGYFFFTVKKGEGEEIDNAGRYFNYHTQDSLIQLFKDKNLSIIEMTENPDLTRSDTTWINVLVKK